METWTNTCRPTPGGLILTHTHSIKRSSPTDFSHQAKADISEQRLQEKAGAGGAGAKAAGARPKPAFGKARGCGSK